MAAKKTSKKTATTKSPIADIAKAVADTAPEMTPEQSRADAIARREACAKDIGAALQKHRCQIAPLFNPPEMIASTTGAPPHKMINSCSWDILPEA